MSFATGFTEQKVPANGIHLRVVSGIDGQKPPLLMLHGIYDRAESWLSVADGLARAHRLIMPDLRGHYRSDRPADGYALSDYAADALGVLDALGIDRAIVLGHSLGALIAMTVAGQAPERVRAVVLEDPPSEIGEGTGAWVGALLSAKNGTPEQTYAALKSIHPERTEEDWRRETEWLRATADGPFLALVDQARGEQESFQDAMDRISRPTLLLQADPSMGGALADEAARVATGSRADRTLVRFPETGHLIHWDRPEKFVDVVTRFLGEI